MRMNRICGFLLVCALSIGCITRPAGAVAGQSNSFIYLRDLSCDILVIDSGNLKPTVETRATGTLDFKVSPGGTKSAGTACSLEAGETVTINCSYSPSSASVDFGLIAPDGYFYYERTTSGNINTTIQVDERGSYTLAVRNNSSSTISVVGFVNY